MKKIQSLPALAAIFSLFSFSAAKAQYGIGGHATFGTTGSSHSVLYSSPIPIIGIGANAYYNFTDKVRLMAQLNYYPTATFTLQPLEMNSFADEDKDVNKLSTLNVPLSAAYALSGNFNEPGFAMYLFAGVDLTSRNWHNTFTPSVSSSFKPADTSHTYSGFTPHIGFGIEIGLKDKIKGFFEAKYSFGNASVDNFSNDNDKFYSGERPAILPATYNPYSYMISMGIRYMLKQPE